jgi:hydroxymethylpyrimidine pyrophosphatase-like HAD family hydrolase
MALTDQQSDILRTFFNSGNFAEEGGVITDLDGTAIHESQGLFTVPKEVEYGLKKIYELGRPIVINTLRFPLSVIRTFGTAWYRISNAPVPTVLMNGSQLGYMLEHTDGTLGYKEIAAFPLERDEIGDVIQKVKNLAEGGLNDLLLFYYPRMWQKGEIIWTPDAGRIVAAKEKYLSAETVYSSEIDELHEQLLSEDICMIFLLVDIPEDKLMAYQHTSKSNFFTHKGINKLTGAREIARLLNFNLRSSVGAGDTEMDTFLQDVGMAVLVGPNILPFQGIYGSINVAGSSELGDLLFELASMQKTVITHD